LRPEPAVEVIVQEHLRQSANEFLCEFHDYGCSATAYRKSMKLLDTSIDRMALLFATEKMQ
jgi:hypothetical protein